MRLSRFRWFAFGCLGFFGLLLLTSCNEDLVVSAPTTEPSITDPSSSDPFYSDPATTLVPSRSPAPIVQGKPVRSANPEVVAKPPLTNPGPPKHPMTVLRNVTYCTGGGETLKMDIAMPVHPGSFPAPVALFIHGGTWQTGDKTGGGLVGYITEDLVDRGYVVAAANYRLAPKFRFPAQIEDVKCAVRYLRASAKKYNLNPQHIGAWGDSAGGQLVSLLGLTDSRAGFDGGGGYDDQSSAVEAVVDMFGRVDIAAAIQPDGTMLKRLAPVFDAKIARRASPINYISKSAPPFLIIHGVKDELVPFAQSLRFFTLLKRAGADATFLPVFNASHEFAPTGEGLVTPSVSEIATEVADFFDKHLKTAQS